MIRLMLLISLTILAGCNSTNTQAVYKKITPEETRKIMLENDNYIILDVRTHEEYTLWHIRGAILIPDYEIKQRAESELPDFDAIILTYCRSGARSQRAARELINMGYKNVYDTGGMSDWLPIP